MIVDDIHLKILRPFCMIVDDIHLKIMRPFCIDSVATLPLPNEHLQEFHCRMTVLDPTFFLVSRLEIHQSFCLWKSVDSHFTDT